MLKEVTLLSAMAAALLFAGGCACTNEPQPSSSKPAPGYYPPMLGDSASCIKPEPQSCPPKRRFSEVKSDLVYDLGGGVVTNSTAVLMPGGYAKPRAVHSPGRVVFCCNPVPARQYEALAVSHSKAAQVAVVPAPIIETANPAEVNVASPIGNNDGAPFNPALNNESKFKNGETVSDAFVLTPEELEKGPQIFYPRSGQFEPRAVETAIAEPVKQPEAPVTAVPMKDELPKPAELERIADQINTPVSIVPLAPPAELAVPNLPSTQDAIPAFPTDKYAASKTVVGQTLPPVPTIADLDGGAEAMLSREDSNSSSLPAVELPPKLN